MATDNSPNADSGPTPGNQGVPIDHAASARTRHADPAAPTDTPDQKQGPNTFSGRDAKDWDRQNS